MRWQAIWRGTTTDHHGVDRLTKDNWLKNHRVQLVQRGARMRGVADFAFTHLWFGARP